MQPAKHPPVYIFRSADSPPNPTLAPALAILRRTLDVAYQRGIITYDQRWDRAAVPDHKKKIIIRILHAFELFWMARRQH